MVTRDFAAMPFARLAHAGAAVGNAATLALLAYAQHAIIGATGRPGDRLGMRPFWMVLLFFVAVVTAAASLR